MTKVTLFQSSPSIKYLSKKDKHLAQVIASIGPISYTPHKDGYAFLVHEIIEQMLSVKAGAKIYGRLKKLCGGKITVKAVSNLSAEQIKSIGTSKAKVGYIQALTKALKIKELSLPSLRKLDDDDVIKTLTSIRGLGIWSAKMYLIFALNRDDVLPYEDAAFLQSYEWLYKTKDRSKEAVKKKCKKWKPYSSIAARYLYRALNEGLTKEEFHLHKPEEKKMSQLESKNNTSIASPMSITLNNNIKILPSSPIVNSKASETYVSVIFNYGAKTWEGYVPIEYRRTGLNIDFSDKNALYAYLNNLYDEMHPDHLDSWHKSQDTFWKSKPNANVTKSFFDVLAKGGWKCGACEMPRNTNPQRRIQDLKEFGYTIATDLSRYCPHCKKNTSQRILLPIERGYSFGNGYETWSVTLRSRILKLLNSFDVYESAFSPHCLPDHKFSEIRWDATTKAENPDTMSDDEIMEKFQLMTNQRNQQKREICRNCFQTGKRGTIYGIPFFYEGGPNWDSSIPKQGKDAEKGCKGCPWYDIAKWRKELLKKLK